MSRTLAVIALVTIASVASAADYELIGDNPEMFALERQAKAVSPTAWRVGDVVHGFTPKMDWTSTFEPGKCYAIVGRVEAAVKTLGLSLYAPDGKRVAKSAAGAATTLRYCATWLGSYHVQVKASGPGTFVVATYSLSGKAGAAKAPPLVAPPSSTPTVAGYAPPPPVYAQPGPVYVQPAPQVVYQPVYVPVQAAPAYAAPAPSSTTVIYGHAPSGNTVVTPVVGTKGADCTSSLDCGPGEFCKEDSYGYKACMGSSMRGMPCSSSIDCGFGMFCKELDGGRDYKVCM